MSNLADPAQALRRCLQTGSRGGVAIKRAPGLTGRLCQRAEARLQFVPLLLGRLELRSQVGFLGGYDLGQDDPSYQGKMLIAVTEMNDRSAIDRLVEGLRKATA